MLSSLKRGPRPTPSPAHWSQISYNLYRHLTFADQPAQDDVRVPSVTMFTFLIPDTAKHAPCSSRQPAPTYSTTPAMSERHAIPPIRGGAPTGCATTRHLRISLCIAPLRDASSRSRPGCAPWPVASHRADVRFRTGCRSARVGFSPLTHGSLEYPYFSFLVFYLVNMTFKARG